jgi:hypothetical protein
MNSPSITEMVKEYFANTPPKEVARLWNELGCGVYAEAGESLDEAQVEVTTFEIKIPLKTAITKDYFEGFCEHIAEQAEKFVLSPTTPLNQPMQDHRDDLVVMANNTNLALAA